MRLTQTWITGCLLLLLFSTSHAQQTEPETNPDQDKGFGFYLDQDLLIPFTNEDRDYTMGIAFEFFWAKEQGLYPLDKLVRKTGRLVGIDETSNDITYSFMLGSLAFTPDDLGNSEPIYDDRPYASLIYLSNKRVVADNHNALAAEALIGVLGTSVAENVQTTIHKINRAVRNTDEPVDPEGWSHQISDGGELTMRLRLSNSRLQLSDPGLWDFATTYSASLGFQTNLAASAAFRMGHIKSPFWSLPYDPVNRGGFIPAKPSNEWYFWGAFRVHLVGYDALLQGQFRDSDVTFSNDEIEHVVYDTAIGMTWGLFGQSQFTIAANTKSADLKISDRNQTWGSINYVYHF